MANRLKAYVRRTILNAARDYAWPKSRRTAESTKSACIDAMNGTDTGWWSDLIYTAPMLKMAHKYRRDIATALDEYRDATGEDFAGGRNTGPYSAAIIAGALLRGPYSFEQYSNDCLEADAALLGLRFAVEWYAGEIANEICDGM